MVLLDLEKSYDTVLTSLLADSWEEIRVYKVCLIKDMYDRVITWVKTCDDMSNYFHFIYTIIT